MFNKYLYYKQKYLQYKMKRSRNESPLGLDSGEISRIMSQKISRTRSVRREIFPVPLFQ